MKTTITIILFLIFCSCNKKKDDIKTSPQIISNCENSEFGTITWNKKVKYGNINDIDGNMYRTIVIGNQEWMAENLKSSSYSNGDEISFCSNISGKKKWSTTSEGAYSFVVTDLDDDGDEGDTISIQTCAGNVYNFYAVIDPRNVCPIGWRVPTVNDWKLLMSYLSENNYLDMGPNLDTTDFIGNPNPLYAGKIEAGNEINDIFGFRAINFDYLDDEFEVISAGSAVFWSVDNFNYKSLCSISNGRMQIINKQVGYIGGNQLTDRRGNYVRCIKN